MQNFNDWNVPDPYAELPLEAISSMAGRATSLLVRHRGKPLLKSGFVNIWGAIEMLAGLEYHHDNFARLSAVYEPLAATDRALDHEAVAYINRMGQFVFFVRSAFVKSAIPNAVNLIPAIERLMIFRNKFGAHRSLDAPRNESEPERIAHARALSSTYGVISTPKPGKVIPLPPDDMALFWDWNRARHRDSHHTYQTFDADKQTHVNFTLQTEHPQICVEAYVVLERLITFEG